MIKKCIISRYDETIKEPPYLTIQIDTVEVDEPETDHLGERFCDILRDACGEKGYVFKFYSMSREEGIDYNIVVYPDGEDEFTNFHKKSEMEQRMVMLAHML